ncbi:MAG TPA: YetF domain-containing protein [Ignavibacteriaceae bacterium]|nr:YetF domain-containing protein [Ignavibacteriaceae bacterium]
MNEFLKVFTEQGSKLNEWQVLLRSLIVFILAIGAVRFGKKKFLGKNSALDMILAVMIGSIASRAINGSGYLLSTILSIAFLIGCHVLLSYMTIKSGKVAGFLEGAGTQVIKKGVFDERMMNKVSLRKEEVLEAARLHGKIEDLSEIEDAFLEANGSISIIPKKK